MYKTCSSLHVQKKIGTITVQLSIAFLRIIMTVLNIYHYFSYNEWRFVCICIIPNNYNVYENSVCMCWPQTKLSSMLQQQQQLQLSQSRYYSNKFHNSIWQRFRIWRRKNQRKLHLWNTKMGKISVWEVKQFTYGEMCRRVCMYIYKINIKKLQLKFKKKYFYNNRMQTIKLWRPATTLF